MGEGLAGRVILWVLNRRSLAGTEFLSLCFRIIIALDDHRDLEVDANRPTDINNALTKDPISSPAIGLSRQYHSKSLRSL